MWNLTCAWTHLVAAGAGRQGWCFQGYKSGGSSAAGRQHWCFPGYKSGDFFAPRHTQNHRCVTCSMILAVCPQMVSVFDMFAVCCCTAPSPAQQFPGPLGLQGQEPDYSQYSIVSAKKSPSSQPQPAQQRQEPGYSQYTNVAAKKSPLSQPQPPGKTKRTVILNARGLSGRIKRVGGEGEWEGGGGEEGKRIGMACFRGHNADIWALGHPRADTHFETTLLPYPFFLPPP